MKTPDYSLKPKHAGKLCDCGNRAVRSRGKDAVCERCFRIEFHYFITSKHSKFKAVQLETL